MSNSDFWKNQEQANLKTKKLNQLKKEIDNWEKIHSKIEELDLLAQKKQDFAESSAWHAQIQNLENQVKNLEKLAFLNSPYDNKNALLSIMAGAGGVDAQDWSAMLLRMYLRFIEHKAWDSKIISQSKGKEAGIKKVSLEIKGNYAYGLLKAEAGVHRLVRISPFDAEKMRHTSFAMVEVLPELNEVEIEIKEDDLKIDTFLASGHGGQSVQKNESAVRITHLPSRITVSCQSERSQYQNKEKAMQILKSKLYLYAQAEREEEKEKLRGEYKSASWGNQIRSYVLHPYKLVKDLRTNHETNDTQKVLDGKLDEFIDQYLEHQQKIK